jgi:hypothetical protein
MAGRDSVVSWGLDDSGVLERGFRDLVTSVKMQYVDFFLTYHR